MEHLALLITIFFLILESIQESTDYCCETQLVSNAGPLDGVYDLERSTTSNPGSVCMDGCVYLKRGDLGREFCFRYVPFGVSEGGNIQCLFTSSEVSFTTLMTTLYSSESSLTTFTSTSTTTTTSACAPKLLVIGEKSAVTKVVFQSVP